MGSTRTLFLLLLSLFDSGTSFNRENIEECAKVLSEELQEMFHRTTFSEEIPKMYSPYMKAEQFDPRAELKRSKQIIEKYMKKRAKDAFEAKISLENRELRNLTDEDVNNPKSKDFIRFMSAKQGTDATTIYAHDHTLTKTYVNATRIFNLTANANFYMLPTSPIASAVHIPTPLYDRDPKFLLKIDWSNIDSFYRTKRDETRDLAFQLFCSESGYMRYYPAASWFWDNADDQLDLFDCRNTEWYINGATCSKNMIVMLDMSGSMLGQRYEIAKQTTEAILETLAHNDYVNIMPFSKNAYFLDDCNGEAGLLQATMRNKKMLRERMDNVTSEGKAEYERALALAFTKLLGLPLPMEWTTKEELEMRPRNFSHSHPIYLSEHVIIVPNGYEQLIENSSSEFVNEGCENVIMLITDGAPNTYEEVFKKYNMQKKVRFFSFLIGDEATEFDQVRWMACNNRGYMVHIANMADVEEKVQNYIRVMSRSVGDNADKVTEKDAVWSGVYRERLYLPRPEKFAEPVPITNHSFHVMNMMAARRKIRIRRQEGRTRMFVTTVSYPVAVDGEFMGVAAVNIPLTEISQLAAPMMIGGRSYYFMLDRNGFVMFHPQLRPIDMNTKYHKPNYNNMDIFELEVPQNAQIISSDRQLICPPDISIVQCVFEQREEIRRMIMECDNSDPQEMDMLFASETLDRVYPQTNTYYTECIGDNNDFILGLAVAKGDDHRVAATGEFNYGGVDPLNWIEHPHWRLHPHWRYCILNDTDTSMPKEDAFLIYARFMKDIKDLPEMCKPRRRLVDRLLWDLMATAPLDAKWQAHEEHLQKHEAHVVYFTSPTGMIRFHNVSLKGFEYADPNFDIFAYLMLDENVYQEKYQHFIAETNRKSVDDRYYRRAIRNDGVIVFDVNYFSKIWYKEEKETPFGNRENVSMLYSAYKSIYLDKAILGVVGMEMGYDALVRILSNHGCQITDERRWCVLLDEHGYVFYSNQKGVTHYDDFYTDAGDAHLGKWFGGINRVAQRAMELLVKKGFYKRFQYVDHQATCKVMPLTTMGASSNESWLRSISRLFFTSLLRLLKQFEFYSAFSFVHHIITPIEAYTTSFHDMRESFSCSKISPFYFSNREAMSKIKSTSLVEGNKSERPCAAKCSVKMQAAFLEGTNLIMVWMIQDPSSANCYDDTQCPVQQPSEVPFGWTRASNSTRPGYEEKIEEKCTEKPMKKTKTKQKCYVMHSSEDGLACSTYTVFSLSSLLLIALRSLL